MDTVVRVGRVRGLVDTHAHVFTRALSMAPGRRYTPAADASTDSYLEVLDRHDVEVGVLVQPSFLGTDNGYLLAALAQHPDRLRGVVVVDPVQPDLLGVLGPGVCGVRLNLAGRASVPDLSDDRWQQTAQSLAQHHCHLEIQGTARQWADLAQAVSQWPGTVVVDHLGLPGPDDAGIVVALAKLEHVWVKLSAPYRSGPGLAARRAHDILAATGGERMVFGSDWPFTQHEASQNYDAQLSWARKTVGRELFDKVLPDNARRLLALPIWAGESAPGSA